MSASENIAGVITAASNKTFLERVQDVPGLNGPGYLGVFTHRRNTDPKMNNGKDFMLGWPCKTADQQISKAFYIAGHSDFHDVWFCTSRQSEAGVNTKGKPKAVRLAKNATSLKAIWVDVDVKADKPEKNYATLREALDAALAFIKTVALPAPSALVNSGGGLHIYWISDAALPTAEWQPYAEGLKALLLREGVKCDAGLTTDEARILRVPGTLNHKYDPPRPVVLLSLGQDYNFANDLSFLKTFGVVPVKPAHTSELVDYDPFAGDADPASFDVPDSAFAGLTPNENVVTGTTVTGARVDPTPIFEQCGFYKEVRATGGRDHDNQLWNLAVLGTTFMESGNEIAHEISCLHPSYTRNETQAFYERKSFERTSRGIGYPSCATIQGAGCKSCAACPLLQDGKSPLNIRPAFSVTVNPAAPGPSAWSSTALQVIFANIPHRRTLYGFDLVRGELTVLGSPGGAGKSSLAIGMGGSIAAGKELLGEKIYGTDLRVLIINAEDSTNEIRRRVLAFGLAHGLAEHELDRLYIAGADDPKVQQISFLRTNVARNISELDVSGLASLEAALEALKPDLVVLDPLIALCAGGNMNDNSSMSLVMRALKRLAAKFDCAMLIVHHTRKGGDAGSAESISGAAAVVNLARRAIMPVGISGDDAISLGILPSERFRYFKLIDAKSNLAPRATDTPLYRLHSIDLQNPEPPTYLFGDNVQAIMRVQLPLQAGAAASSDDQKIRQAILDLVDRGKMIDGLSYPYSPSSAGADNARAILGDAIAVAQTATSPHQWAAGDLEAIIKAMLKELQRDGRLISKKMEELMPDPGRFRRLRGLQIDHAHNAQGGSHAASNMSAA